MDSRIVRRLVRSTAAGSVILLSSLTVDAGGHLGHREPERPQVSAGCQPMWGFNQTCWRQFPPVPPCDNSPLDPAGNAFQSSGIYVPQSHPGMNVSGSPTGAWETGPSDNSWSVLPPSQAGSVEPMATGSGIPSGRYAPETQLPRASSPSVTMPPGFSNQIQSPPAIPFSPGGPPAVPQVPGNLPPLPGSLAPIPESTLPPHQSRYAPSGNRYAPRPSGLLVPAESLALPAATQGGNLVSGRYGSRPQQQLYTPQLPQAGMSNSLPSYDLTIPVQSVSSPVQQSAPIAYPMTPNLSAANQYSAPMFPSQQRVNATPVSASGRYGAVRQPVAQAPAVQPPVAAQPAQFISQSSPYGNRYAMPAPSRMPVPVRTAQLSVPVAEGPAEPLILNGSLPRLHPASMSQPLKKTP